MKSGSFPGACSSCARNVFNWSAPSHQICRPFVFEKLGEPRERLGSKPRNESANDTNCAWTALSNDSFITITSGSSGFGSGTVHYTVAANTSTNELRPVVAAETARHRRTRCTVAPGNGGSSTACFVSGTPTGS